MTSPRTDNTHHGPSQGPLLSFQVGAHRFCVPALKVETIMMVPRFRSLPGTSGSTVGVFSHRHRVVTIVCLRRKFGLERRPHPADGQLVLSHISSGLTGFWVDSVHDIFPAGQPPAQRLAFLTALTAFDRFMLIGEETHLLSDFEQLWRVADMPRPPEAIAVPAQAKTAVCAGRADDQTPAALPPLSGSGAHRHGRDYRADARPTLKNPQAPPPPLIRQRVQHSGPAARSQRPLPAGPNGTRCGGQRRSIVRAPLRHCKTAMDGIDGPDRIAPVHAAGRTFNGAGRLAQRRWMLGAAAIAALLLMMAGWRTLIDKPAVLEPSVPPVISAADPGQKRPDAVPARRREAGPRPQRPPENTASSVSAGSDRPQAASVRQWAAVASPLHPRWSKAADAELLRIDTDDFTLVVERPVASDRQAAIEGRDGRGAGAGPAERHRPADARWVQHVVVSGDTLWDIAAGHLGDPFRYPELAQLSRIKDPDWIYPGDIIKIYPKSPAVE